ncbi:MAG TPA: ABC transporter substrate-binding protein [Chloroflexota bacterium]|nr:ABC transporter substrate-binding protein [Chloroflexota bacterium]
MIRRLCILIAIILGLALGPRQATTQAAPTNASFALNWLTNVEFAGIWMAQKQGWWSQAGLHVTARGYDFTNDPVLLIGAGKYTFGFQDGASLIIARAKGIPLKAVWASAQQSPFAFITMPNSHITTVKDFRGKRIGYQAHQLYVLQAMLNHEGMSLSDVKPVVVQFDPTVLLAGKVDAYLAFITNEPIALADKGVKVNIIKASDYGYDFYSDVLFTTDNTIKTQPGLVRKVVQIINRGWQYAIAHPAATAQYVVKTAKLDTQDTVAQQTAEMQALGRLSSGPDGARGAMQPARWQHGINLLLKYKQITSSLPASAIFTSQFLPAH